jgi:hypothetical protein
LLVGASIHFASAALCEGGSATPCRNEHHGCIIHFSGKASFIIWLAALMATSEYALVAVV